jgi:hypothetical protein
MVDVPPRHGNEDYRFERGNYQPSLLIKFADSRYIEKR